MLIPMAYPRLMIGVFMFIEHLHETVVSQTVGECTYRYKIQYKQYRLLPSNHNQRSYRRKTQLTIHVADGYFFPPVTLYFDRIIHYTGNG
jgi:hypothetical protein